MSALSAISSITSMDNTCSQQNISLLNLLKTFMLQGLGELLILCRKQDQMYLGKMFCENEKYIVRNEGYLSDINADSMLPCWGNCVLGAIYSKADAPWSGLTFCGLEHCDLKVDLSKTSHRALQAAENQYGDHLIDFTGSVYQGFQLMLDNYFLPVVLLTRIRIKSGESGLAVTDLRAAPLPISTILTVNNIANESIKKHLKVDVDDMQVNPEQFDSLFQDYLSKV